MHRKEGDDAALEKAIAQAAFTSSVDISNLQHARIAISIIEYDVTRMAMSLFGQEGPIPGDEWHRVRLQVAEALGAVREVVLGPRVRDFDDDRIFP